MEAEGVFIREAAMKVTLDDVRDALNEMRSFRSSNRSLN